MNRKAPADRAPRAAAELAGAARRLLAAIAREKSAGTVLTWTQTATLAGLAAAGDVRPVPADAAARRDG